MIIDCMERESKHTKQSVPGEYEKNKDVFLTLSS